MRKPNPLEQHPRLLVMLGLVSIAATQCTTPSAIRLALGNCSIPGISAYGIQLGIGEQGQAQVCGAGSTVTNSILLITQEACQGEGLKNPTLTPNQCNSRRGSPIHRNDFAAFEANGQIPELVSLNPAWVTLMRLEGLEPFRYALRAPIQLEGRTVTLLEGLIVQGQNHSLHHIGLGSNSSLLGELVSKGMIAGRSWGFNAGSQSYSSPREGSLVLGGKDGNSYEGALVEFPFNRGERPVKRRQCPLQIAATDLTIQLTVNGSTELAPLRYNDSTVTSGFCIESYDNLFRLGPTKVNDIVKAAGINLVNRSAYPGIYNMEEGLVFPSNISLTMSMDITIENKFTITIPSSELVNPLRGWDSEGKLAVVPEYTEIGIFKSNPLEDSAVLGKVFLSQVYLFVDWDKESFYLGRQKQRDDIAPVLVPSKPGSCPNPGSEPQRLSPRDIGLISGLVVLGVVVIALGALGFFLWRRTPGQQQPRGGITLCGRRSRPPSPDRDTSPVPSPLGLDDTTATTDGAARIPWGQRLRDLFGH